MEFTLPEVADSSTQYRGVEKQHSLSSNNKMIKTIKSRIGVFVYLSQCYDIKADHGNKNHREMDTVDASSLFERLTDNFMCPPLCRIFLFAVYGKAFK